MVERICPACGHGNPLENRFCGGCGASLERNELVRRPQTSLVVAGQQVSIEQLKQVGTAVAVGLAAVAAEAAMAYLRARTASTTPAPPALPVVRAKAEMPAATGQLVNRAVTIVSQRVVEVWEHGTLTRQTIERNIWRREGG